MIRTIIFILIIIVLLVIAALATGFLDINQLRGARAPHISATGNGVTASGGQAPAFDVQTGSVKVGATRKTVTVPSLVVQKPGENQAAPATGNGM